MMHPCKQLPEIYRMSEKPVLDALKKAEALVGVPENELQWLIDHGEVLELQDGDYLFRKGMKTEHLQIVLEGRINIFFDQQGQRRNVANLIEGSITGVLPYSRMTESNGFGEVTAPTKVLSLHKDQFRAMIQTQEQLTEALVHVMTTRVREFTKQAQQNEKLMSLGKLSAGLAHELNNPASAIVRGALALKNNLQSSPDQFKAVTSIRMSEEQIDTINDILFAKVGQTCNLSLLQRTDLEDEFLDWLEDHDVEDADIVASNLVENGWQMEDLETVKNNLPKAFFLPVFKWIDNVMTTEKLVEEIEDSANRISDLVKSVKSYTHMDRGTDKEWLDLRTGLRSTLTMLNHKLKQKSIVVEEKFEEGLPEVKVHPGELNQVWTNLIDNAVDAMEKGGKLVLHAYRDREFVRVDVMDNGSGIPQEIVTQIFDPFFTTKEMGKGTGLGLDIVKRIVASHKGDIKVQSGADGTTFKLCFPIDLVEA